MKLIDKSDLSKILNKHIPSIIEHIDEDTINEIYEKSSQRYNSMLVQVTNANDSIINTPSFIEYITLADRANDIVMLHYVSEINTAFKILLSKYPQYIDKLKKVAVRLLNAISIELNDLYDWQNIATELLVMTKLFNKDVEIKDIEYELDNDKLIDIYVNHKDFGELLCEFRSIHINIENSITKIKSSVEKKIQDKITDKTKELDTQTLPNGKLAFLFVIQNHSGLELSQELLKALNEIKVGSIVLPLTVEILVLPLMVGRLGRTQEGNAHFEIVQIEGLIK